MKSLISYSVSVCLGGGEAKRKKKGEEKKASEWGGYKKEEEEGRGDIYQRLKVILTTR